MKSEFHINSNILTITSCFALLFIWFVVPCKGQDNEIISQLASVSQRLGLKESDFSELEPILNNKKVIAFGEATHGTKEFGELFSNLIQFNIEKLGYTAFAFEADFIACQAINDYITLKVDSLDYLKASGFPMSKEKRAVFEWMRKWNGALGNDKTLVEVFGLEVRNLRAAIRHVIDQCSKLEITTSEIQPFLTKEISQVDKKAYREGITFLEQLLQNEDFSIAEIDRHMVNMTLKNITHQRRQQTAFNKARYIGTRDRAMFESACWILDATPHDNLILWAHSAHIAKSDIFGGDPLGKFLHDRYRNEYVAIGTTFGSGDVNLFVKENNQYMFGHRHFELPAKDDFYEYYLDRVSLNTFFIDLRKAQGDDLLRGFFDKKRKFRFIGGTAEAKHAQNVRLSCLFDVVIYVSTSSLIFED